MAEYKLHCMHPSPGISHSTITFTANASYLCLKNVAADTEVHVLLVLALRLLGELVLRHFAAKGTSLLGAKVQGLELLVLVKLTHVSTLLKVDHGEHTGDILADRVTDKVSSGDNRIARTCGRSCSRRHRQPSGHED